jgi:hypothetical protein
MKFDPPGSQNFGKSEKFQSDPCQQKKLKKTWKSTEKSEKVGSRFGPGALHTSADGV